MFPIRPESTLCIILLLLAPVAAPGDDLPPLGWTPDRRLTFDPAASKTAINFARSAALDSRGRVHVVWEETRAGAVHIRYMRSDRGGESWHGSRRLAAGLQPAIALSRGRAYVVWHRPDGDTSHVYLARSADGGSTWSPPTRLSAGTNGGAHASVAAAGNRVHVASGGREDVHGEVFVRTSLDGGRSWRDALRISEVPFDSWVPTLAAEGRSVYYGWVDYQDANEEEYLRVSTDAGRTWDPPQRLSFDRADSWASTLAVSGGVVHLVWFDRRAARVSDARVEAALNRALELVGLDPAPPPLRDPAVYYLPGFRQRLAEKLTALLHAAPGWVASGGDPLELERRLERFDCLRRRWAQGWEIYYRRSDDAGLTWTPTRRLTRAPLPSLRPSIAADGPDLHLVWFDGRDGNEEIYYKHSADGGDSWGPDVRLTYAPGGSRHPTVALSRDWVHVVWYDERDGNAEIYTKRKPR